MTKARDVAFQVRMPPAVHEILHQYAQATGSSMNAVVNDAVVRFLQDTRRQQEVMDRFAKARKDYRLALDKLRDL